MGGLATAEEWRNGCTQAKGYRTGVVWGRNPAHYGEAQRRFSPRTSTPEVSTMVKSPVIGTAPPWGRTTPRLMSRALWRIRYANLI